MSESIRFEMLMMLTVRLSESSTKLSFRQEGKHDIVYFQLRQHMR
jgi:hypothetical protein